MSNQTASDGTDGGRTAISRPSQRPSRPLFSSGPTAKHPGWNLSDLTIDQIGRSHRSKGVRQMIESIKGLQHKLLVIPADWVLMILPASDTGAFEAAMWGLLGPKGVDILVWDSFGAGWSSDIRTQLKLDDIRVLSADYGDLPVLGDVDSKRDIVVTWNGTTSGVCLPNADWIADDREGLVLCDATSAVFAMDIAWNKMDAVTWSWQKALGGEAQHGMLALSPRAIQRLNEWTPPWPIPKIFRLTGKGKVLENLFAGDTINTPSWLALADFHDALLWAEKQGGRTVFKKQCQESLSHIAAWVSKTPWVDFLCQDPASRSWTSVCLTLKSTCDEQAKSLVSKVVAFLEKEGVAYDIQSYRDAPPGLRIWCGPTVPTSDVAALLPWIEWAYNRAQAGQ